MGKVSVALKKKKKKHCVNPALTQAEAMALCLLGVQGKATGVCGQATPQ